MKNNLFYIIIASSLILSGCGSKGGPDLSPDASRKTIGNVPDWFMDRLYKSGLFTMDLTKFDGTVPQIGDNDSGRLFKITPIGEFITNSNRSVFESIDKHQQEINESIPDKDIKTSCPDCGHEYLTPFTFDQSNFFALAS